jgi:hypothetical protein
MNTDEDCTHSHRDAGRHGVLPGYRRALRKKTHQTICALPEQFRELIVESNMEFASLGPEFIELLEIDAGKEAMGRSGSALKKFFAYIRLSGKSDAISRQMVQKQYEIVKYTNPEIQIMKKRQD